MLWLSWADQTASGDALSSGHVPDARALLPMLAGVLGLVAIMAVWARLLIRHHADSYAPLPSRAFRYAMVVARTGMVVWYGVCLYVFGFGDFVDDLLAPIAGWHVRLPGLLFATWPVLLGWFGLWWGAYPVERATREGNLLAEIDAGLTPRAPPSLRDTLLGNFRMQVLFMLAPVVAVICMRDVASLIRRALGVPMGGPIETIVFISSILLVFIAAPELLVRVLRAKSLEPSPLRERLEAMAVQLHLRYHDILIWHTSHGIGNAAVMGLVPRFRYILLTDLLIETLDDRQIEAVFAHEAGHVKHRHLLWYKVFFAIFVLCLAGPGTWAYQALRRSDLLADWPADMIVTLGTMVLFFLLFGMLARLFEKQADVYAARSIQSREMPAIASANPLRTPVGSIGAESFVNALCRVAEINHMPATRGQRPRNVIAAGFAHVVDVASNFLHPSIPDRVDHLRSIAIDANRTTRFDQKVVLVMLGMLFILMTLSAWVCIMQFRST